MARIVRRAAEVWRPCGCRLYCNTQRYALVLGCQEGGHEDWMSQGGRGAVVFRREGHCLGFGRVGFFSVWKKNTYTGPLNFYFFMVNAFIVGFYS